MSEILSAEVENGLVKQVIVGDVEWAKKHLDGSWVDATDKECGIGYTYDELNDVFIAPKPFDSWLFDGTTFSWIAPLPRPEGENYWDEVAGAWVEVENEAL